MTVTEELVDRLVAFRSHVGRSSTAERVADVLRGQLIEGTLAPGARLSEEAIGSALGVSRNTLRESFRLLGHERLLVHEFNRGVFVAKPTADDVVDLYRARRPQELAALRAAEHAPDEAIARVGEALARGERAYGDGDWWGIGTENMRFHEAIAALAGSPRVDEFVRRLLAELRLVFHVMSVPREFHAPYLGRNREIYELLRAGRVEAAADHLAAYLDDAEHQLVEAFTTLDGR
ncbi:GntR family transcriptional regulator [Halostreptopolyspora alba]|uniref:GntR family transcriptional regulator n=1 Tax=Halostreptopolyspora alba TaxID=2487137 RepID=A0A3N0EAZ5_9ACTN|nr:GntR family transcriptional regulator [Nocardiopsaceae bacterium YIM 96095]